MFNETYDEYIRNILGYDNTNKNIINNSIQNNKPSIQNYELEKCYPEIYKIIYPMITKKCNNTKKEITKEEIENITDEIYFAIEQNNTTQININLNNDINVSPLQQKSSNPKAEIKITNMKEDKRETRNINGGLRDLIKILLIRELVNKPNRPPMPGGKPPFGGPIQGPRPNYGRPPFGTIPGVYPFNRDIDNFNYDIYEY